MNDDTNVIYPPIGDRRYQEKVVQALFQDYEFAEQMGDVLRPDFFDQDYLHDIVREFFDFKQKYSSFPSNEIIYDIIQKNGSTDIVKSQVRAFLGDVVNKPLNGDMRYIQDNSLDFCRRQSMKEAIVKVLDMVDEGKYDACAKVITDAMTKGSSRDVGHEYMAGFQYRSEKSVRQPLRTPWPVLNSVLCGGWERKTLTTFIAPTGAGKTHFLTNVSAGAIAEGYNVVYITLELADFKIGLRHDAYFSGIEINNVANLMDRVEQEVRSIATGELFIKEFPTKMASVQTIRAYLQRLKTLHSFEPDIVVIDYADLLQPSKRYGEKRHELEGVYEELRGLSQDLNIVVVTADQTNRSGLNQEVVTLDSIAESYAKATVCDLIMTISRTMDDKLTNTGRLFVAKSRLGPDGRVYPFRMVPATVKVNILDEVMTPNEAFEEGKESEDERLRNRFKELCSGGSK